jgi:hypothetical protein
METKTRMKIDVEQIIIRSTTIIAPHNIYAVVSLSISVPQPPWMPSSRLLVEATTVGDCVATTQY